MRTVAIFSQKGGSGKTTLALHLAVAAQEAGLRSAVIDLDPQRSALHWAEARKRVRGNDSPLVVSVPAAELANAIKGGKAEGFDLLILDCAPHASAAAASTLQMADLVLIPVRPSPMDLAAVPATLGLVGKKKAAFVLSAAPLRAPEVAEMAEILAGHKLPVLGPVHDRRSLFRAFTAGQAVSEFEPGGQAAAEIKTLYTSIKEIMK